MKTHPDFRGPRNGYDDQLDAVRPGAARDLYNEMSGRNDAAIKSKDVLEDLAQSTACETAYLRALSGLVAANNEARADLAAVIAPPRHQIEAEPLPRVLRQAPAPVEQKPSNPHISRLQDRITEAMPKRRAG